jgi:hypothetical protein
MALPPCYLPRPAPDGAELRGLTRKAADLTSRWPSPRLLPWQREHFRV